MEGALKLQDIISRMSLPDEVRDRLTAEARRWAALSDDERRAELERQDAERARAATRAYYERLRCNTGLRGNQLRNTFANYRLLGTKFEQETQRGAWAAAVRFSQQWPNRKKGLMFYGDPGRGKDHLLHAIVNTLRERPGKPARIYYAFGLDLIKTLEDYERRNDPDEESPEGRLRRLDLLLIGDLDRCFGISDQGAIAARAEEAVLRVINHAESTGKPIICATSNFDRTSWQTLAGASIASRLAKLMTWYNVAGPDRRQIVNEEEQE